MTIDTETPFSLGDLADVAKMYREAQIEEKAAAEKCATLNRILKQHIIDTGEPIEVEGLPTLKVVSRRGRWAWDVQSFAIDEPGEFGRALQMGAVTLVHGVLAELEKNSQITSVYQRYGHQGSTDALVWDE